MILTDAGIPYVTAAAARTFANARGLQLEQARRQLTELLLDARLTQPAEPSRPAAYRARSRASQLDITARVVVEGRLAVIVSINVRDYL